MGVSLGLSKGGGKLQGLWRESRLVVWKFGRSGVEKVIVMIATPWGGMGKNYVRYKKLGL